MKLVLTAALVLAQAAPIFRFETDGFWLNLHHFLYVLGRVESKMPDSKRDAVAGAPAEEAEGLTLLSEQERQAWREAVAVYAASVSKRDAVFDRAMFDLTNTLRRAPENGAAATLAIEPEVAAALDRAAAIYRKAWWERHRDSNRRWVESMHAPLQQYGKKVLSYLSRAYQEPWMQEGYPVNVSAWSNWAGAYSTNDSLLVVSSRSKGNQGLHGFEITFHEAMHQWDDEMDARLLKIAKANDLKFDDLLSHAMIFYTTGEAMKTVVPAHVPYAELAGIWKGRMGVYKPALDAHWQPYLDGKSTMDAALIALLKSR